MAEEQQEFEYDIAVSFAGEQRDYVKAIVRGVGADVKVFYDEDEKAKLWGENLIDLLTDVYQHKARYVVMFVSAAYAEKMWTNVERQSAMARAARQRGAYVLPIRMDDTELPGLLHTVGYLDSRHEGLDGIIRIIRDKLGAERAGASYAGRVPQTQADIDLLLAVRPDFWEYWLWAGTLRVRLDALEVKYRDYELGFAPLSGQSYFDREAFDFLRTAPAQAGALINNFNAVFRPDAQARAFGEPGEPGDADRITHLAERFIDTYEAFMDEAARIRGASLPEDFREAQEAAAHFGSHAVEQIRAFVTEVVDSLNRLPEMARERSDDEDEPLMLTLVIELTVDPEVMRRFNSGLRTGVASLGVDVDELD